MTRAFLLGLAALVPAAALIATAWHAPPPPTPRPAPVAEPIRAPKGDRLAMVIEQLPPSPTIVPVAVAATPAPAEAPPAPTRQRAPRDVCAAHGMHREYYKGRGGWQRWRCVR